MQTDPFLELLFDAPLPTNDLAGMQLIKSCSLFYSLVFQL